MPNCIELLPCDWLISNLCYQAIEQVYLIKWPMSVYIYMYIHSICCKPCSGSAWQIPAAHLYWHTPCPPSNPPTILHQFLVFLPLSLLSLLHPFLPPRALSAPTRSVVLWPQSPRWCQVSIWTEWCALEFSATFPGQLSLPSPGLWRANLQSSFLMLSLAFVLPWWREWPWL